MLSARGAVPGAAGHWDPTVAQEDGQRLRRHALLARPHRPRCCCSLRACCPFIDRGSRSSSEGRRRVVLLEREVNAYLRFQAASQLPPGVAEPHITLARGGRVVARARIDLDAVAAGRERSVLDPLSYLRGNLPVTASGILEVRDGIGRIQVESVTVAGLPVPALVLDLLVRFHSRSAAYPLGFDLADPFELPYRIREIDVAAGQAVIVQ